MVIINFDNKEYRLQTFFLPGLKIHFSQGAILYINVIDKYESVIAFLFDMLLFASTNSPDIVEEIKNKITNLHKKPESITDNVVENFLLQDCTRIKGANKLLMSDSAFLGENALVYLEESIATRRIPSFMVMKNGTVFIGKNSHIDNTEYFWCNEDNFIFIGKGCLIAQKAFIRSDSAHLVLSISEKKIINSNIRNGILIGDQVWLGSRVIMSSNAFIGSGSILSAGTCFINAICPSISIMKGNMPVIKKTNVTFSTWRLTPETENPFETLYSELPHFENTWSSKNMFDYVNKGLTGTVSKRIEFLKSIAKMPIESRFVVPAIQEKNDKPYSHAQYDTFIKLNKRSKCFIEKNKTILLKLPLSKVKMLEKLQRNPSQFYRDSHSTVARVAGSVCLSPVFRATLGRILINLTKYYICK